MTLDQPKLKSLLYSAMEEGQGSSERMTYCLEIETAADSLDESTIFHTVNDVAGFILYMHQQIPSMLQDISLEFDTLSEEYSELEIGLKQTLGNASLRRKHASKMREAKQGIRRFDKLIRSVSDFQTAVKLMIGEVPNIQAAILVLGASPLRPQQVYELSFSRGNSAPVKPFDFAKTRAAEALSRKVIRTLISMGAGSASFPGISKLFLLILPFRVRLKCRIQAHQDMDDNDHEHHTGSSTDSAESIPNEFIRYQCRHVIKGLAFNSQNEE